jgi:hypothetical protein
VTGRRKICRSPPTAAKTAGDASDRVSFACTSTHVFC